MSLCTGQISYWLSHSGNPLNLMGKLLRLFTSLCFIPGIKSLGLAILEGACSWELSSLMYTISLCRRGLYWGPSSWSMWILASEREESSLLGFWLCVNPTWFLPGLESEANHSLQALQVKEEGGGWDDAYTGPLSGTWHGRKRQWLNSAGLEELTNS